MARDIRAHPLRIRANRFLLIDGNAIVHRAYHAYPQTLRTSKGELINAVYGFTSILLSVLKDLRPKYVAVAFDLKGPTFRHKKFKGYKASRPEMDEELVDQLDRVKQVVSTLNIPIFEKKGFEADDVIGTLALQAKVPNLKSQISNLKSATQKTELENSKTLKLPDSKNLGIIIATGDRDALQLIDNHVKVYLPARGKKPAELVGRKEFIKKYRFEPERLVDLKALAGDASDEIPGVKGVGPKTATDLIVRFGDLKSIYKSLDEIKESVRLKLVKDKKKAFLSYELAEIETAVPIKLKLKKCKLADYDRDKVLELFEELEFRTLISRLPDDGWQEMVKKEMGIDSDRKGATLKNRTSTSVGDTENTEKKDRQMKLF